MYIHPAALEAELESYFSLPETSSLSVDAEIKRWKLYAQTGGTEETPLPSLLAMKKEGIKVFNRYDRKEIDDAYLFEQLYSKQLDQYIQLRKEKTPEKAGFVSEKDFVESELERIDGEESYFKHLAKESKYYHQLKRWIEFLNQKYNTLITVSQAKNLPTNPKEDSNTTALKSIFKQPEHYQKCLTVLDRFEVQELGPREAGVLFAIIDTIKTKFPSILIHDDFTDDELLSIFNAHLGRDYKQLKRNSKTFRSTKDELKSVFSIV